MALLNTDKIKKETLETIIVLPMLRLNKAQREGANNNMIIGEMTNQNVSLRDTISEYGTLDIMSIAYNTFTELKKNVKNMNLSNLRHLAKMTELISNIEDLEVKKIVSLLNNKVMIKNIIDQMYIVSTIEVVLQEEGTVLYSYIKTRFLGDGTELDSNTLCQASTKNEKLKSSDIHKGSTPKIEMEFINLAQKYQTEKVKFDSFKEYMEFNKVQILEMNKDLYETKTKIINNYVTR